MQLNEAVSRRLVELMQERGMTQYQLYMRSGVPKSTIEMFTKTLAIEVAKYGIRVNCVAPGLILTGVMSRYSDRDVEGFRRKIAAGYLATPEDIVPMIQFFADVEKTKYIVGQTIAVDGGQSIDGAIDCMLEDEF